MKIIRHWHREVESALRSDGQPYHLISWGGSEVDLTEARQKALDKLREWKERLSRGEDIQHYEYRNTEIREELVEEILDPSGNLIGAITRNRYGALVLNSASTFIADVDAPEPGFFEKIKSLFGKKIKDKDYYRAKLESFMKVHSDQTMLLYETHSGFRVFVVDQDFDPASKASTGLLESLGSDRLYQKLCSSQECYRARLTPKPWRCYLATPPGLFPRKSSEEKVAFDNWLHQYSRASMKYTVCRLLKKSGNRRPTEQAEQIIRAHDAIAINQEAQKFA